MNPKVKDIVGIVLVIVLLLAGYSAFSYSRSYGKSVYPPAFSVTGEGKVAAVPDIAQFSFSIISQGGKDINSLQKDNTTKANAVISFLKKEGIDEEDIKTSQYSINPRYNFNQPRALSGDGPNDEIIGYTISQSVEVKIKDFAKIGDVLNGAVEAGANSISSFHFTFDDPIALTNEARVEAIAEAKRKAKLVASAGGFRIGRLLSIEEGGFYPYDNYNSKANFGVAYDSAESVRALAPSIEPGSEELIVNVTLRYEIKD